MSDLVNTLFTLVTECAGMVPQMCLSSWILNIYVNILSDHVGFLRSLTTARRQITQLGDQPQPYLKTNSFVTKRLVN